MTHEQRILARRERLESQIVALEPRVRLCLNLLQVEVSEPVLRELTILVIKRNRLVLLMSRLAPMSLHYEVVSKAIVQIEAKVAAINPELV